MRPIPRRGRVGSHAHLHLHAEIVRGGPDEGAVEWDRVVRIADHRNGDKACRPNTAAGWVEIDPTDVGHIYLRPGVGRSATQAKQALLRIIKRGGEIP